MRFVLVLATASFVVSPAAFAQTTWYESLEKPIRIDLRIEYFAELSDADYAALRTRVAGHPEHPDRPLLESEQRRRKEGPAVVLQSVWIDASGVRRFNSTNNADGLFHDIAIDEPDGWALSQHQLTLIRTSGDKVPEAQALLSQLDGMESTLALLSTKGRSLNVLTSNEAWFQEESREVSAHEGLILSRVVEPDRVIIEITTCESAPEFIGQQWVVSGNLPIQPGVSEIGRLLTEKRPDGGTSIATTIESIVSVSPSELKAITTQPSLDHPDSVRGEPTYTTVHDLTRGSAETTTQTASGDAIKFHGTPRRSTVSHRLRTIGWLSAGVIAGVLLGLRIRRAFRTAGQS